MTGEVLEGRRRALEAAKKNLICATALTTSRIESTQLTLAFYDWVLARFGKEPYVLLNEDFYDAAAYACGFSQSAARTYLRRLTCSFGPLAKQIRNGDRVLVWRHEQAQLPP
jgi:hypothetical protein